MNEWCYTLPEERMSHSEVQGRLLYLKYQRTLSLYLPDHCHSVKFLFQSINLWGPSRIIPRTDYTCMYCKNYCTSMCVRSKQTYTRKHQPIYIYMYLLHWCQPVLFSHDKSFIPYMSDIRMAHLDYTIVHGLLWSKHGCTSFILYL